MIGDANRREIIAQTPTLALITGARIDFRSIPVGDNDTPLTNPHLGVTNFWIYLGKSYNTQQKKKNKPYYIYEDFNRRAVRFKNIEELQEIAKNDEVVSFLLKWGYPIEQPMLDMLDYNGKIQFNLFPFDCIKKYDEYLREYIYKQYGVYPPPEKSMFCSPEQVFAYQEVSEANSVAWRERIYTVKTKQEVIDRFASSILKAQQ